MKILIVTEAWDPQVNGVVRTLKMTRRELEALGHRVALLTPQRFRSLPCPTYPDIRLALATRRAVAEVIDAESPDCLHLATEGPLGWAARAVARARGWPFTTAFHSRFPEYVQARIGLPPAWTHALLRRFHNAGQATLVPTPAIREDLAARGYTRTRLWGRGVDLQTFHPEGPRWPRGASPVFLYVGRLAVEKNVEAFLDLDLPGEKWVAGDGPARARLEARCPEARWFGVLDGPSLATLYRSADVMVFPSRTDTFGLVMLEAMACGTPVAAFPVPGPLDVVGQGPGGVLHPDLREACLRALERPRAAVRAEAERHGWAAASAQFLAALAPIPRHAGMAAQRPA